MGKYAHDTKRLLMLAQTKLRPRSLGALSKRILTDSREVADKGASEKPN